MRVSLVPEKRLIQTDRPEGDQIYLIPFFLVTRLSATQVAREFSAVVNRIGSGEEIEVVRNGVPVVEMRQTTASRLISAAGWDALMQSIPSPDEDFARDVEAARKEAGPPPHSWPS